MTDVNREKISLAVDGELSKEELRFLLRRLDHDVSLRQAWSNYHLAGESLRRQLPALAHQDFASRVMFAIENDQAHLETATRQPRHWLRWSAGGAIAASVAAAALLLSQPAGSPSVTPRAPLSASVAPRAAGVSNISASDSAPAAVPAWLGGNGVSQLSQRASMTLGGPNDSSLAPYADSVSPYELSHYRAIKRDDGSYLLLIDASQAPAVQGQRKAAAAAH